jgi:hypothetical protein
MRPPWSPGTFSGLFFYFCPFSSSLDPRIALAAIIGCRVFSEVMAAFHGSFPKPFGRPDVLTQGDAWFQVSSSVPAQVRPEKRSLNASLNHRAAS